MQPTDDCRRNHPDAVCQVVDRVLVGDSTQFLHRIPDASVDVVVQDPPYGIDFKSGFRKHKILTTDGIKGDYRNNVEMLSANLRETVRVMKPNSHLYMFTRWDKAGDHAELLRQNGLTVKNSIVWDKSNWSMGDLEGAYANQYEVILFAQKGKKPLNCIPTEDGRLNKHGNPEICRHPDILRFDRVANGKTMLHNHQKPTELLEFLIKKSSNEGDVVLDGFLGSGSTAVAARNTKRHFIGIELDHAIAQTAVQRLSLP